MTHRLGDGPRRAQSAAVLRRRRWAMSWRAALRLAHRDARRHRGTSVLIVVMIGLPVLIITAGSALLGTLDVTVEESVPVSLGNAQAKITDDRVGAVTQSPDGTTSSATDPKSQAPFADHESGEPWTAAQLARLTGAEVSRVGYPTLVARQGTALLRSTALAHDLKLLPRTGLAELRTGRWPAAPEEVAVTEAGVTAGLPTAGPLDLQAESGAVRAVRVTGVVAAAQPDYRPVHLVVGADWLPTEGSAAQFLLLREQPVSWADVQSWNRHGLLVLSKAVLADPPKTWDTAGMGSDDQAAMSGAIVVLLALGLVLETTLLAGPAFAVSATRRRQSLALVASNGAERAQLVRHVLAQAVVLGGGAVILGSLLGIGAGWAVARIAAAAALTDGRPPLDVYAWVVVFVAVAALGASLLAAALPARGAAGLAVTTNLRAGGVRPQPSLRAPMLGGALLAGGVAGLLLAATWPPSSSRLLVTGLSGALLIVGSLFQISLLLRLMGRVSGRGTVAMRVAARDLSRARSRTVPAIAAITAAMAGLTMVSISATSDDEEARRKYRPNAPAGRGVVYNESSPPTTGRPAELEQIRRQHPDWRIEPRGQLGSNRYSQGGLQSVVAAVPPGCSPAEAVTTPAEAGAGAEDDRCRRLGNNGAGPIRVVSAAGLPAEAGLTPQQRETLNAGGILVTEPSLIAGGTVRLAVGGSSTGPSGQRAVKREVAVPAAVLTLSQLQAATWFWDAWTTGGLMLVDGATRHNLPVVEEQWEVIDPSGPISRADEKAINSRSTLMLEVERGFTSPTGLIFTVLYSIAGALVAVAALVSTALAQAESQQDLATMASLGATVGFRRRLVASQTALVAFLGVGLGVLAGIAPGIGLAVPLTTESYSPTPAPPIVVVPWPTLLAVAVSVPLLAATVAMVAVRRVPVMTRRLG